MNHHLRVTANASNAGWEKSLTDDIIDQCEPKSILHLLILYGVATSADARGKICGKIVEELN